MPATPRPPPPSRPGRSPPHRLSAAIADVPPPGGRSRIRRRRDPPAGSAGARRAPPRRRARSARSRRGRPPREDGSPVPPSPGDRRGGTGNPRRGRGPGPRGSGVAQVGGDLAARTLADVGLGPSEGDRDPVRLGRRRPGGSTAWARLSWASGRPTNSTARAAASATTRASGSARPMSSLARITRRRAMNRASSPASSIRASQYSPASGSDPRMDLMSALDLVVVGVGPLVQQPARPGPGRRPRP